MGCVSSKLCAREETRRRGNIYRRKDIYASHVVSLTSTTYGVLKLDHHDQTHTANDDSEEEREVVVVDSRKSSSSSSCHEEGPTEIINSLELMEGLEDEVEVTLHQSKEVPKSRPSADLNGKVKKVWGKENRCSPKAVLKECNNNKLSQSAKKPSPRLWASVKGQRCDSLRVVDSGIFLSRGKRSLATLFDSKLKKDVYDEHKEEEIKKTDKTFYESNAILMSREKKCPPGGESSVVLYTTTLRGIRKTFEDCNVVRKVIESHNVRMIERDVSMHSGYREELRELMGTKEVKVPLVFVKGRLIGGAEEVLRLDEEGKLGILFDGISEVKGSCGSCKMCGGMRFLVCVECNGSCRVLSGDRRKKVKCDECNENGLIHCPLCGV